MTAHPMDDIPVRQLRFDFDSAPEPVWHRIMKRNFGDGTSVFEIVLVRGDHQEEFEIVVMGEHVSGDATSLMALCNELLEMIACPEKQWENLPTQSRHQCCVDPRRCVAVWTVTGRCDF